MGILIVILPLGFVFLSKGEGSTTLHWQWPWVLMVLSTVGLLFTNMMLSLLEGCGEVKQVSKVRLFSSMSMSLAMWITLPAGGKLYAAPAANTAMLIYASYWLWKSKKIILKQMFFETHILSPIQWRKEVWPMQWKSALSFINGYLMFQLFNPILFHLDSPITAGKMGISTNLAGAALNVSLAWISTKAVPFCTFVSEKNWQEMDRVFFNALRQSLVILVFTLAMLYTCVYMLNIHFPGIAQRFLDLKSLAWLMLAVIANHILFSYAIYLRAHKEDPFVFLTLLGGILMPIGTILAIKHYGVLGLTFTYAVLAWLIGVGGGTWIFLRKRALWHK